jgi:hypothetical protein
MAMSVGSWLGSSTRTGGPIDASQHRSLPAQVTEGDPEDGHTVMADLETVRLAIVAAALFKLKIFAANVSHAYMQANTKEQVYTVAGPEFGRLEGLVFDIVKALYGLQTSGAQLEEKLNDTLRSLSFTNSNTGSVLWIRRKSDQYEYMSTLVDDILKYTPRNLKR